MAECARMCLGTVLSSQQHQRLCTRCASICCLLLSYFYLNVYCKDWHLCGWVSPELQELKCTSACQQVEMPSLNVWKMQNAHPMTSNDIHSIYSQSSPMFPWIPFTHLDRAADVEPKDMFDGSPGPLWFAPLASHLQQLTFLIQNHRIEKHRTHGKMTIVYGNLENRWK